MSETKIDEKQIKDYRIWTGTFQSTGMSISGDVAVSGLTSGTEGYFRELSVENLTVSNAIISTYLSGIVGTSITGSGIIQFLSTPDVSGNNIHFRHIVHVGDADYPIQQFSSFENQDDWFYFNNGAWAAFPVGGLPSAVQNNSLVRHIWSPTGMDVFTKYYSDLQTIYGGNITGGFNNSYEFQSPTNGFTINHIPFWQSYFDTADSRYVTKKQYGIDYVPSGIKVSGVPVIVPVSGTLPFANDGSGSLVAVNERLYIYSNGGFRPVSLFTGLSVTSGGMVTGSNPILSGMGQVVTQIQGNNVIGISGGGVDQFAVSGLGFQQGNIIFAKRGNVALDAVNTSSGVMLHISGGVDSFAIPSGVARKGNLIVSGAGYLAITERLTPSGTMFVVSGIGDGITGPGNITGLGVNLNGGTTLTTGGFVITGESRIATYVKDYGNNISGIVVSGTSGVVDTIALVSGVPRQGNIILSGKGGVEISEILTSSGAMFVFSGGAGAGGGGGVGNVTGLSVNLDDILYTGGFVISGEGGTSVRIQDLGNNISGIIVSGNGTFNTFNNTYNISGNVLVTGFGIGSDEGILCTGGVLISGENGITTYFRDAGVNISGIIVSGTRYTALNVSGTDTLGNMRLTGVGGTQVIQSGTNILVSGGAGGGADILQVQIFT